MRLLLKVLKKTGEGKSTKYLCQHVNPSTQKNEGELEVLSHSHLSLYLLLGYEVRVETQRNGKKQLGDELITVIKTKGNSSSRDNLNNLPSF